MLTMVRTAALTVLAVAIASMAGAQSLSLSGPSLSPDRNSVTVRVDAQPRPDPSVFKEPTLWVVVARSAKNVVGVQLKIKSVEPTQFYQATGLTRLTLVETAAADVESVDVISLLGKPSRVTWSQDKPQGGLGFFPVDKRDKSDVYLFGSWVSGPDKAPTYNLDVSVGAPVTEVTLLGSDYRLAASFTLKTAEKRDVDPDSYVLAAKLGRVYPIDLDDAGPYLDFQWDVARLEFSRKDSFKNFVSAPAVTLSHALFVRLTKEKFVRAAINAELTGAIEAGGNMQSKDLPEGYGGIFRVVPGASIYAAFPEALGFDEIRWTSTYRARILTTKEPFIDVRDDDHPFASLAKGTRHEWKDQLDFKVTPLLSLTFTHEYGSTPPAFKILGHRFTLGATAMWAWRK